jgi:predicted lipoprotein with Yx(FWY)xxD motif
VDAKGRTLYAFELDSGIDETACGGGCSSTWPGLKAKKPKAGKGLDASLLEVGASGQVAYNGHLLYKYAGDSAAGDTNGNGIGGVWHAVDESGEFVS